MFSKIAVLASNLPAHVSRVLAAANIVLTMSFPVLSSGASWIVSVNEASGKSSGFGSPLVLPSDNFSSSSAPLGPKTCGGTLEASFLAVSSGTLVGLRLRVFSAMARSTRDTPPQKVWCRQRSVEKEKKTSDIGGNKWQHSKNETYAYVTWQSMSLVLLSHLTSYEPKCTRTLWNMAAVFAWHAKTHFGPLANKSLSCSWNNSYLRENHKQHVSFGVGLRNCSTKGGVASLEVSQNQPDTLPKTNSSSLKMDGWDTSVLSFWEPAPFNSSYIC